MKQFYAPFFFKSDEIYKLLVCNLAIIE